MPDQLPSMTPRSRTSAKIMATSRPPISSLASPSESGCSWFCCLSGRFFCIRASCKGRRHPSRRMLLTKYQNIDSVPGREGRLLVLPNNDVIVAEQRTGYLTLLRDQDRDGRADYIERYADDFKAPYGLAYRDGFVLVADQEGIWRGPHVSAAVRGGGPGPAKDTTCPPA